MDKKHTNTFQNALKVSAWKYKKNSSWKSFWIIITIKKHPRRMIILHGTQSFKYISKYSCLIYG